MAIQTRPVRRSPPRAGRAALKVLKRLSRNTGFLDPALAENWEAIAGPEIAQLVRPSQMTHRGGRGTLYVDAPNGAAAMLMNTQTEVLRERVNRALGAGRIKRIVIRQTASGAPARRAAPVEPGAPAASTGDRLADALTRWRARIEGADGQTPQPPPSRK